MENRKVEKECPWCTICLVIAAMTCHSLVLWGNCSFAASLGDIGQSTNGWANVGIDLSESLHDELDPIIATVSANLTQVIDKILEIKTNIDDAIFHIGDMADGATATGKAALLQAKGHVQRKRKQLPIGTTGQIEDLTWMMQTTEITRRANASALPDVPDVPDFNATATCQDTLVTIRQEVNKTAYDTMAKVSGLLEEFFLFIKPTLIQIGAWLITFGTKVQTTIEGFSKTLDVVQKMMDQIMAKIATPVEGSEEDMIYNTYTLFDVSQSGGVNAADLQAVGELYGITALKGDKAEALVDVYDADRDGELDDQEYALFVADPSIPGSMAVVLRAFAKKLSQIAGNVAAARMRDEVASAVVDYFTLICAKNATKVSWVSQTLTNGSLPAEFSASVLKNLALDKDNPNKMTDADVGQTVLEEMVRLNGSYVQDLLELLADPEFFESEGFDMDSQSEVVEQVTDWVMTAEKKSTALYQTPLLGLLSLDTQEKLQKEAHEAESLRAAILKHAYIEAGVKEEPRMQSAEEVMMQMRSAARSLVLKRSKSFRARKRAVRAARKAKLESSETADTFFDDILGGANAGSTDEDPDATRVTNAGQPAVPETLQFAQFLSWNATQTADRFQGYCVDYMGDTSATLDSFANQIQTMIKKMGGFLKIMMPYATERGINDLQEWIFNFTESAAADIMEVFETRVMSKFEELNCPDLSIVDEKVADVKEAAEKAKEAAEEKIAKGIEAAEEKVAKGKEAAEEKLAQGKEAAEKAKEAAEEKVAKGKEAAAAASNAIEGKGEELQDLALEAAQPAISNAIPLIVSVLKVMQSILPAVIDDLKFARKEVSAVSQQLDSIFSMMSFKAPPIFASIASSYRMVWIIFYSMYVAITLGILYYGFWAAGWFGGPQKEQPTPDYEPPHTVREYVATCCRSCCHCLGTCIGTCSDTGLYFWSCMILFEIVILVLFLVSIVITLVAGLKTFMAAGCADVFFLGEAEICGGILGILQTFIPTFRQGTVLHEQCVEDKLLTCEILAGNARFNYWYSVLANIAAALVSLQLIMQSGKLHEQARWRLTAAALAEKQDI